MNEDRLAGLPAGLRDALLDYEQRLRSRFGARLRKVALFGSWARGEAGPESDIDVLVCIDGADWREEREAAGLAGDTAVEKGEWLSPVVYDTARFNRLVGMETPFALSVLREGIVL